MLVAGKLSKVQGVKQELLGQFQGKDIGEAGVFVGFKKGQGRAHVAHFSACARTAAGGKGVNYSSKGQRPTHQHCRSGGSSRDGLVEKGQALYWEVVGSLLYLSTHTRPDLAHVTGVLSRYMANPTAGQRTVAKGAVRYLRGTSSMGISYIWRRDGREGSRGVCRQRFCWGQR